MATLVIGIVAVYSIATGRSAYLDVAIILALIAFLGTVAFAYYLQRGKNQQRDKNQ
jgi:multicomponent Na+:H+ antiporter subunit F